MTLAEFCKTEFGNNDRNRGNSRELLASVHIKEAGRFGVLAIVDGTQQDHNLVGIDLSEAQDGYLGVHCDCPRFESGYFCKHLWATIRNVDRIYPIEYELPELELHPVHPANIEIGPAQRPLRKPFRADDELSTQREMVAATAPVQKPIVKTGGSSWKAKLQAVAAVSSGQSTIADSGLPGVLRDAPVQTQHWFVISVSDPQNQRNLNVTVMRSIRRGSGPWSQPTPLEIDPDEDSGVECPLERTAIGTLSFRDWDRFGYPMFAVPPEQMSNSLAAMQATGRLAWKLGESTRHFEDAQPITEVSVNAPWQLVLNILPNDTNNKKFDIAPRIQRADNAIAVEDIIWVSEIGCALIQDNTAQSSRDVSGFEITPTRLVKISPEQAVQMTAWQQVGSLTVPKRSLRTALTDLSSSAAQTPISLDPSLGITVCLGEPRPKCAFLQQERYESVFDASLSVHYDDVELSYESPRHWWFDRDTKTIIERNWKAEAGFLESVSEKIKEFERDSFQQSLDVTPESFIAIIEKLQSAGWEVTADGAPIRIASDFDISVSSGVDWFDLNGEVDFNGQSASLPTLLKALEKGERSIVLDDGSQGMLPKQWLEQFVGAQACGETCGDAIRFHRTQALLLDALLEEHGNISSDRDYTRFVKQLKAFDGIKPAIAPKSFEGSLREYQQVGLGWFDFLQRFNFGGCLADDMGLGKTIQVLALLDRRRLKRIPTGTVRKPSIVVVPKSLIGNWIEEAAKFTPKLRLFNYTGADRKPLLLEAQTSKSPPHVLLTTYGTLRNDVPKLCEEEFDYVILDEAQAIKNPQSLASKSARLLKGDHRLAMTGTPVENHLGDLWALFDFLNPGMLKAGMTSRLPQLDDEEDRKRIEQIGDSLRPFILRRTKKQVLKDLPDKVEQTLSCEMPFKQRKLYDELREHYRVHLSNKVEELGIKRSKIHVLEALLRLRQASCDPRLVKPDCDVRGAKIDMLINQLSEIIENGHKAIVFSQFTSLLSLVRNDIDDRKWDYEYLDGKTRKRADRVKRFQTQKDCQLFLISLKAGGTGLNLTAAQYVFILDPWWNPAVEAQAIDRAHRIGQTNCVNAYRMICSDTVEEKIVELQESKRDLADAIISQDKSLISDLTADDLQTLLG